MAKGYNNTAISVVLNKPTTAIAKILNRVYAKVCPPALSGSDLAPADGYVWDKRTYLTIWVINKYQEELQQRLRQTQEMQR